MHAHKCNAIHSETASISLESAICAVMFSFSVCFLISLLQYIYVYNAAENASLSAAEKFSCYSSLLHESGLASLTEAVKIRILNRTGVYDNEALAPLAELAERAFNEADSSLYRSVLINLIKSELEKNYLCAEIPFKVEVVSLAGSSFFTDGHGFDLHVNCKSDFLLPIPFMKSKGYSINVCVKGICWMSGGASPYTVEDIQVWQLGNFERGRVLQKIYGANLPENFPVIDIYNEPEKIVTMIVSIDHTSPSYQKSGELNKTIRKAARKLNDFDGAEFNGYAVKNKNIKKKVLLLIMPKNRATMSQSKELIEVSAHCASIGIDMRIEYYQVSNR